MADNWKNNILPGNNDLDMGSLAYNESNSLEEIAGKYNALGSQVNKLIKAAADDVSARQVKLIGNDFGGVNPMMYASYYQPAIAGALSDVRMAGADKALEEGMERGKAAAEANLNNAKNNYSSSVDAYNNAKEAFKNLAIAKLPSGLLPDGVTEDDFTLGSTFTDDSKEDLVNRYKKYYTDQQGIDWSNKQRWADASAKTISESGIDTSNFSQSDWDNFWADNNIGRAFEYNYVSDAIRKDFGEERYQSFVASYDNIVNVIEGLSDYAKGLTDSLPDVDFNYFVLGSETSPTAFAGGSITLLLDKLDDGTTNADVRRRTLSQLVTESWINENIDEAYREDILAKARELRILSGSSVNNQQSKNRIKSLDYRWSDSPKGREEYFEYLAKKKDGSLKDAKKQFAKELGYEGKDIDTAYLNYIKAKLAPTDDTPDAIAMSADELVKNLVGLDVKDLAWLKQWKEENPSEFESYKLQLAMSTGKMDAMEVADGKRWYYTNNGYVQLKAGTPVFFAPDGALNDDGSIKSENLKEFCELWKDYYSADVNAISEKELTDKQTALNEAYKKYITEISLNSMVNSQFDVKITPDVYNSIQSCLGDPSKSDLTLADGTKISDYIKQFNELGNDSKLRELMTIARGAYSRTDKFLHYDSISGGLVSSDLQYDADSDASKMGASEKLDRYFGKNVEQPDEKQVSDYVAKFLVLTRSMEKYNQGAKEGNIDPGFMAEDFVPMFAKKIASQGFGALDFAIGIGSTIGGFITALPRAMYGDYRAPWEYGGIIGEAVLGDNSNSLSNIMAPIFGGDRTYNSKSRLDRTEIGLMADEQAREYMKEMVNPLLVDVIMGDKKVSDIRGVADWASLRNKGMFSSPYSFLNTAENLTAMVMVNLVEGKVIGAVGNTVGKISAQIQLKTLPFAMNSALNRRAAQTVQIGSEWVDNLDDPYLAATTAKNTLELSSLEGVSSTITDSIGAGVSVVDRLDDLAPAVKTAGQAAEESAWFATNISSRPTSIAGALSNADDFFGGSVTYGTAYKMSSLNPTSLDDIMDVYGSSVKKFTSYLDAATDVLKGSGSANSVVAQAVSGTQIVKKISDSLPRVVLANGESVSFAEAAMAVTANRVTGVYTLSMATGINPIALASLPDKARNTLLKTLNGITGESSGAVVNGSAKMFLSTLTGDDFKILANKFIERAAINAQYGKAWDIYDTYRAMGAAGWENSGMAALGREFLIDALTDPLRDFKRNLQVPQLDDSGNVRSQTIGQYFSDPSNILQNLLFSTVHFGMGRVKAQVGYSHYMSKLRKAENAIQATGDGKLMQDPALMEKINTYMAKAQQYADLAWKKGQSYDKVVEAYTASNEYLDKAFLETYGKNGWDFEHNGEVKHFDTIEEVRKFLNSVPPKEMSMVAINMTQLKAALNYTLFTKQLGQGINEFGNLTPNIMRALYRVADNSAKEHKESFTGNGKTFAENNHALYQLMKADILSANERGDFGITIRHLDKSLDSYFNNLETMVNKGMEEGFMPNARLGYIPTGSLYYDGSYDDMVASHTNAAFRGLTTVGEVVDMSAPDVTMARNYFDMDNLLDAMDRGDKTMDIMDKEGNILRTVTLDYEGLNPIDNLMVYANNYHMAKYINPIWGSGRKNFGAAAARRGWAYASADNATMQKAWSDKMERATNAISGYSFKKNGKTIHHKGWSEKIVERLQAENKIDETQAKELRKNFVTMSKLGQKELEAFDKTASEMAEQKSTITKATSVIKYGDIPESGYPIVGSVLFNDDGKIDLAAEGKRYWNNGQKIASRLVKAYTDGEIDENTKTFTIEVKYNGKTAYKDLPIDDTVRGMLKKAGEQSGQFSSDLVSWSIFNHDIVTPYYGKSVKDGVTTYQYAKNYQSKLKTKYSPASKKTKTNKAKNGKSANGAQALVETATNGTGKLDFGGKEFDARKLITKPISIRRSNDPNDGADITSRESTFKYQKEAVVTQLNKSIKMDNASAKERIINSVIDRATVEAADYVDPDSPAPLTFPEFIAHIDRIAPDGDIIEMYGSNYAKYEYNGKTRNMNLATFTQTLDRNNLVIEFAHWLDEIQARAQAGDYINKLPDGMSGDDVAVMAKNVRLLFASALDYNNKPKAFQTLGQMEDEEGNLLEDYRYAQTDINGQPLDEVMSGRSVDINKDIILQQLQDYRTIAKAFYDRSDPLHKVFAGESISKMIAERTEALETVAKYANDLNTKAKEFYADGKGEDSQFNSAVDKAKGNRALRTKNRGGDAAGKYEYLEALNVAAPGTGINQVNNSRGYNAAMLERATGIPDTSEEGWNTSITDARIEAGTIGGHLRQIIRGYETLSEMTGKSYTKEINALKKLVGSEAENIKGTLPEHLMAVRSNSEDNMENSLTALFGDVGDDNSAIKPMDNAQREFQALKNREMVNRIGNRVLGDITSANKSLIPSNKKPSKLELLQSKDTAVKYYDDFRMLAEAYDSIYPDGFDESGEPIKPAATKENPTPIARTDEKAVAGFRSTLESLYSKYIKPEERAKEADIKGAVSNESSLSKGNNKNNVSFEDFSRRVMSEMDTIRNALWRIDDSSAQTRASKGGSISESAQMGKKSLFTPEQLNLVSGTTYLRGRNFTEEIIPVNLGDGNTMNVTVSVEYGTGNLTSSTGVALHFLNAEDNTEIDLNSLSSDAKAELLSRVGEAFDDEGKDFTVIKASDYLSRGEKNLNKFGEPLEGKAVWDENGKLTRISTQDYRIKIESRIAEIDKLIPIVTEQMKDARGLGDLKENAEYDAARKQLEALTKEKQSLSEELAGASVGGYEGDVLQDLGDDYYLVERASQWEAEEPDFEPTNTRRGPLSEEEILHRAMADYAEKTKDYSPEKELEKSKKSLDSAKKKYDAASEKAETQKKKVDAERITLKDVASEVLNADELRAFNKAYTTWENYKTHKPANEATQWRASDGTIFIIDSSQPVQTGFVKLSDLLLTLGYNPKKFNNDISEARTYTEAEVAQDLKDRKAMMKEVNKNLRKGNVVYKNVEAYKNPTKLDLKSRTMTINNLLAFAKQFKDASGLEKLGYNNVVISKDYADTLYRISREGIGPKGLKQKAYSLMMAQNEWNQFIQQTQLAGGASYVNALSNAMLRGAILSSPRHMAEYIRLATDFKDDAAVKAFFVDNQELLSGVAWKVQDPTVVTDLVASASDKPGLEDGGTIAKTMNTIREAAKNSKATKRTAGEKYNFISDAIQAPVEALWGEATFKRVLPVLRAKMMINYYDDALRVIKDKFPKIDDDSAFDAACKFAYAKAEAFFNPNETTSGMFKSRKIDDVLQSIADHRLRDTLSNVTGAKADASIGQLAHNCFFALSYKNRMVQPLVQGVRSMLSPAEWGQRMRTAGTFDVTGDMSISGNSIMNDLGTQFMQSGNRSMVGMLALISAIAFINAKALGLSTPWDDLTFIDEGDVDENGNPRLKVPEILKKFQTVGQIWLPNAVDENGRLTVDPTKRQFSIDTMSSVFTLPNTFWKTVDRTINPNDYYSAPQRGIGLIGQEVINPQGINNILNQPLLRAIGDELIGSNLLSPYKAAYEILVDSSYYGNNIWEKKYLADGSKNPNYDPVRNMKASFFHILGFDDMLDPDGYNRWVKGYYTNNYKAQDQVGTISGAGLFSHEYVTMFKNIAEGKTLEGIIEGGELPIKSRSLSSTARTEFNTKVKNIIAQYMKEYRDIADNTTDAKTKDEAYATAVKKSADAVAAWSKKHDYALGRDQKLVPFATRAMMALLAGEYDDNLDYIQNTYWKASDIAQIEASGPAEYWLDDADLQLWVDSGKTTEEFAEEKNKRTNAYYKALDDEYLARKALKEAGIDNEYLAGMTYENLRAEQRLVNKQVHTEVMKTLESPIGQFDNFKEMKKYYEAEIEAATTAKAKAKIANQYNNYLTDKLAPYVQKYGAAIFSDSKYNGKYLSNELAEYVIIPADKYYRGKSPQASYLRDLFHVGYNDKSALPSDDEVIEGYAQARTQMVKGASASSAAILDQIIDAIKKGRLYATDSDYSKIVRMKALLSARSK